MNIEAIQDFLNAVVNRQKTNPSSSADVQNFYNQCRDVLAKINEYPAIQSKAFKFDVRSATEGFNKLKEVTTDRQSDKDEREDDEVDSSSTAVQNPFWQWMDPLNPGLLKKGLTVQLSDLNQETRAAIESLLTEGVDQLTSMEEIEQMLMKLQEQLKTSETLSQELQLPELEAGAFEWVEMDEFPELNWETKSFDDDLADLTNTMALTEEGTTESFLSKGWSDQVLSQKAEELGVKAPEAGFNQRLNELLGQTSGYMGQEVALNPTQATTTEQTTVQWGKRDLLMKQIMNHASLMKEGDVSKLKLTLMPKHLGTMQLEFEMIQGELRGRIVTQTKEVAQWMEKAIQSLSSETLSLKTVQVETQSSTDAFLFNQNQSSQQENQKSSNQASIWKQGALLLEEEEFENSEAYIDQDVRLIF